jgi:hypothetical protein
MTSEFSNLFSHFITRPGAEEGAILSACLTLKFKPYADFLNVLQFTNGGEGFIRHSYFHLYSLDEMLSLNQAYQVSTFAPGLVIFGSNGGGDAFGFDTRHDPMQIVQISFIPMDFKYAELLGGNFMEFLHTLSEFNAEEDFVPDINMSALGKEVHEIQPIVFGGDPVDEKNKKLLPPEAHAKLCVFWNGVYLQHKK